jgi:hypothetical protein
MMDITELKLYQERALQAEEIRNPLTTAGGFARRLAEKLPEDDPNRKAACIIAEDVGKLEQILRMMLQSIEPVTIHVELEDLEQFFLPRLPFEVSSRVLDLPLSRIIVNKHGWKIEVFRGEQDMIMVRLVLPIRSPVLQG